MNRTEYIGKLNALYVGDKNCLEELITAYDEKGKEIERLNKRNKEIYEGFMATTKELTEYAEEVERLNNIINELDKQKEVLDKVLFVLEHIEDDRSGYEAIKEMLKGSEKSE